MLDKKYYNRKKKYFDQNNQNESFNIIPCGSFLSIFIQENAGGP